MGDFNEAVKIVFSHEGGFVDNPDDRGGPTKFGITQKTLSKFLNATVTVNTMRDLDEATARAIYKKNYWDVMRLDEIKDQRLCNIMMDLGVLQGTAAPVKALQRLLLDLEYDDGIMGPMTINAANESKTFRDHPVDALPLWVLQDSTEDFFMLAIKNPTQRKFLNGWINRVGSLIKIALN